MLRNWQKEDMQNAGEHEKFMQNVVKWVEQGYTNPELCFVWDDGSLIKGGIVFIAENVEEIHILDFSLSPDSFNLGSELLNQSLNRISAQRVCCYNLYNDNEYYNDYKKCFIDAGFSVVQEKLSYRFTKQTLEDKPSKLEFRSYNTVGEKEFENAVALVTQHTLDRLDAATVAKYGQTEAARIYMNKLKEIAFDPETWMLAYIDDKLIGLVVPANFEDSYGAINYIGVVPEKRGKGYVDYLLKKGTELLLNQGVTIIIADTDALNLPMQNACKRIGYDFFSEEVVLEKRIV